MLTKQEKRIRRHKKILKVLSGTKDRPRLLVYRSNQHIYARLVVDNDVPKIVASVSDMDLKVKKGKKSDIAKEVGKLIAQKAAEKKIEKVVFDRGGLVFHGRVKFLAEGAREAGLKF